MQIFFNIQFIDFYSKHMSLFDSHFYLLFFEQSEFKILYNDLYSVMIFLFQCTICTNIQNNYSLSTNIMLLYL